MPKERSVNPATAALKQQKQRSIKKNKALQTTQRTEKLARRNPDRLQKQIDGLTSQREAQGGSLRPKDQQTLEALEKDLRMVKKAREMRGDERPHERRERRDGGGAGSVLGKRGRDSYGARRDDRESETDEDVRAIPMPRDTPPPMPPRHLRDAQMRGQHGNALPDQKEAFAARDQGSSAAPVALAQAPRTTYESAPVIRDLQKEATSRFVPAAVAARRKAKTTPGGAGGRLLEPEELDKMEQEAADKKARRVAADVDIKIAVDLDEEEKALQRELADEAGQDAAEVVAETEKEAHFKMMAHAAETGDMEIGTSQVERTLRHVEMEEVSDEDG